VAGSLATDLTHSLPVVEDRRLGIAGKPRLDGFKFSSNFGDFVAKPLGEILQPLAERQ
jgi:hypothetical protein